jgi:MbtH protein
MTNPFERQDGRYLVLRNDEDQHSLWPADFAVPAGWAVVHGEADRNDCLAYVESNWTDLRPAALRSATG